MGWGTETLMGGGRKDGGDWEVEKRMWNFRFLFLGLVLGMASAGNGAEVVAHRGASGEAPENTMAAFRLAWERGADAVEGDFWMTADGEVVCIHDGNTKKVAGVELDVRKSTLAELQALDVGSWKGAKWSGERVPVLADVLASVPDGKKILIEIKDSERIVEKVWEAVKGSSLARDQVRVISFSEKVVASSKKTMPKVKAFWLVDRKKVEKMGVARVVERAKALEADGLDVQAGEVPDGQLMAAAREAGLEFHVWTVNEPERAKAFAEAGVDSVTTDWPGKVRETFDR